MLVLSRRVNESIVFPGTQTSIQVLSTKPGVVRLGIDAPPEVRVLRSELQDRAAEWAAPLPAAACPEPDTHRQARLRKRLKAAGAGVGLARLQLGAGLTDEAAETLGKLQRGIEVMRRGLEGKDKKTRPTASPRRALLVEDDRNERELLASFLRLAGFDVDTAGDGADALDLLRQRARPDVVLMDMGLPRCDGPTAVRAIRQDPALAGLKIFAVSGHPADEFQLQNGPAGIDRWFRKPLDAAGLVRDLEHELDAQPCRLKPAGIV